MLPFTCTYSLPTTPHNETEANGLCHTSCDFLSVSWSARRYISNKNQLDIFSNTFHFLFFLPCDFFVSFLSASLLLELRLQEFVLFWRACCWYSGLGVLTVDTVCFSIHSTLAASTVDDTGTLPCLLWSPTFPHPPSPLFLPSLVPHTLHLSHHYNPHLPLSPFHLLLILLISLPVLSFSSFYSFSPSPSFSHSHLPPPLPLAKVHVINQTKMRLWLCLAVVESYI